VVSFLNSLTIATNGEDTGVKDKSTISGMYGGSAIRTQRMLTIQGEATF